MKVVKSKVALIVAIILVLIGLSACGSAEPVELTNKAEWDNRTLELLNAEIDKETGLLKVHATFTNGKEEPEYALACFAVRAFQNDTEINEAWEMVNEHNLTTEVKNGKSIDVIYFYQLVDMSPVEILIGSPTAEQTTIGKQTYTLENE